MKKNFLEWTYWKLLGMKDRLFGNKVFFFVLKLGESFVCRYHTKFGNKQGRNQIGFDLDRFHLLREILWNTISNFCIIVEVKFGFAIILLVILVTFFQMMCPLGVVVVDKICFGPGLLSQVYLQL